MCLVSLKLSYSTLDFLQPTQAKQTRLACRLVAARTRLLKFICLEHGPNLTHIDNKVII